MAEYIDRAEFLKRIEPYNTPDKTDKALYNFALNKMMETPNADVVELEKIDKAILKMERYSTFFEYANRHDLASAVDRCIGMIQKNIGDSK